MSYSITLTFILVFNLVKTEYYNVENGTHVFQFFKQNYDKNYENDEAENKALRAFINNLNEVEALNGNATDGKSMYVINKFADIDPKEYEHKYAISIAPYDNVLGNDMEDEYLRQEKSKKQGNGQMYNLDDAEELYKKYLEKYNKTEPLGKTKRLKSYLRFVKTLVDINQNHFNGNQNIDLDNKADVIREPNKFFFR